MPCLPKDARTSTIVAAFVLSRPVVGSSRNKIRGQWRSSLATLTRFFSPPDIPLVYSSPMKLSTTFIRPSSRIMSLTRIFFSAGVQVGGSLRLAWKRRYSHTVEVPGKISLWGAYPAICVIICGVTGLPFTRMSPETCPIVFLPAKISSSVVFPAPEGPRMAKSPVPMSSSPSDLVPAIPDTWSSMQRRELLVTMVFETLTQVKQRTRSLSASARM